MLPQQSCQFDGESQQVVCISPAESPAQLGVPRSCVHAPQQSRQLSQCEKYRVAFGFYLFQRKGKIAIKPQKRMVFANKSRFRSRLCKGKVLAPLISIVLNGNHLLVSMHMDVVYMNVVALGEMR